MAYADFVTALMALFIVLWLMNSSQRVKASVSGYFKDPQEFERRAAARSVNKSGEGLVVDRNSMGEIRKQLEQALRAMPEFSHLRNQVKVSLSDDGLRIDLLENEQGIFFVTGSAEPSDAGQKLLHVLAAEISRLPNDLVIEGHTDARPFRNTAALRYSNWELSADRANAARRLLEAAGVRREQVVEVRGFADHRPFISEDRNDAKNRRVSVVVRFTE